MGRFSAALAAAVAVSLVASIAGASELDPSSGSIVLAPGALRTYGFESATDLVGKVSTTKTASGFPPKLTVTKVADATMIAPLLATDAVEGKSALRLAGGVGVAIDDAALFTQLSTRRFEVTFWGRADGIAPSLQVRYARPDSTIDSNSSFASVTTMRTGRETSDGWAEYSTGPLDGAVWGIPVRLIIMTTSPNSPKGTSFLVDALEIRELPGTPVLANACTFADMDTTCGPMGDCLYGRCVPASVTWGALPPLAHRAELVSRWIHYATRTIGDRRASEIGKTTFTASAQDLAKYALSSRQFFGGMNRLVNLLRDNHTSFGGPNNFFSAIGATGFGGWSAGLHACFGVMEKDAMGGGLVYGVFDAGTEPTTGFVLKKGDVVTAIDGRDPKAWVDDVWPVVSHSLNNDPAADLGPSASALAELITDRAKTMTIARCASPTKCTGGDRSEWTIEVATKIFPRILEKQGWGAVKYFGCSARFHDSVDKIDEPPSGEDAVTVRSLPGGIMVAQFDGFSGGDGWDAKFTDLFTPSPPKVIMDAREGHGGLGSAVQTMLSLMRGASEPIGFLTVIRGGYDDPDPSALFKQYEPCASDAGRGVLACFGAWGFFADVGLPPGAASKVAWLNTIDISANDYMPRLLKGRSKLRIFAPHPTAGAFGAITSLPALTAGWSGGSMQYQDSRFGADYEAVSGARWESSHGVEPDVVVAQKQTDAMKDRDTLLEAATAWLSE